MDLSKLPKLSQTPTAADSPPPAPADAPASPPIAGTSAPTAHCRACGLPLRPSARFCDSCGAATVSASVGGVQAGADAWISIACGFVLLLMYPTMIKYLSSKIFGTSFVPFTLPDGQIVPYPKVYPQFFSDLCISLFAIVLVIEGVALCLVRSRKIVAIAFTMTVLVTLLNLLYVFMTTSTYGIPLVSIIAIAFGVYIAIQQWTTLKLSRA